MRSTSSGASSVRLVGWCIAVAVVAISGVAPALAQISAVGSTTSLRNGAVRGVDVAYDPNANTYMVVGAQGNVFAVCTNAAGAPISPIFELKPPGTVNGNLPFGSFPKVAYSADINGGAGGFMVIWQVEEPTGGYSTLHARAVSCTAGPLGTEQIVDGGTAYGVGPWTDFGASGLAYSATSRQFLVVWKTFSPAVVKARFIDLAGAGVGPVVQLSSGFGRDPDVAWNPISNEFGVSYSGETPTAGFSVFVRVPADNLAGYARQSFNAIPGSLTTVTDIAFNTETQRYVMVWWQFLNQSAKMAEFDAAGNMLTTGLISTTLGSYDALSLGYNPISRTFGLVGLDRPTDAVLAAELNSRGYKTSGEVKIYIPPSSTTLLARYTRVAASTTEKKWNSAFNTQFAATVDQLFATTSSDGGPPGAYPPPDGVCLFGLNPTSSSASAAGGTGSFSVLTTTGCTWTATTSMPWIHITAGASGVSAGTVSYSIDPNPDGGARTGTITAGGQTFTIVQGGSCSYSLSPTSSGTFAAGGGSDGFSVSATAGCAWTATTSAPWIRITSLGTGTGNGTVTYAVEPNMGAARVDVILAGGQSHTVSQAAFVLPPGCTLTTVLAKPTPPAGVSGVEGMWQSTGITLTAGQATTVSAGGTWTSGGVTLTGAGYPQSVVTGADCPLSGAPLLALIGRIGPTGTPFLIGSSKSWTPTTTGVLYLAPQDNWYQAWDNTGSLTVLVCLGAGGGCSYVLNPTASGTIAAVGGSGSFTVSTGSACAWTATTTDGWIHVTGGSGPGGGTVTYTVDANAGTARTGTITAGGQTFTVSQAAATPPACQTIGVLARPTPPAGVSGAEGLWQSTGITLTAGQSVTVTATGTWSNAGVALTAAGQASTVVTGADCPLSGAPLLALIGRIGPTGTPFLIGASKSWTPTTSGVLYVAPQDNWYLTWDNAGSLSVAICR